MVAISRKGVFRTVGLAAVIRVRVSHLGAIAPLQQLTQIGNLANHPRGGHHFSMQFDYEIPIEEYTAAQVLYYKACAKGQFARRPLVWGLLGLFFVLIAILRWQTDWTPILLVLTGAWFIYCAIKMMFPVRHYRKFYPESRLADKKFHAELDANGLSVNGDGCSWRVPWTETLLKGEDKRVFMFSGKGTIFIFGKKYLTDEQQKEIRGFAAIRS